MKKLMLFAILAVLCLTCVSFQKSDIKCVSSNADTSGAETFGYVDVPIIMYHRTWAKNPNKYSVTLKTLESDLVFLKENGFTSIFMRDLIDFTENGKDLPEKPIILTFDDGSLTNYLYAFPLLKKYNTKAVFSVVGKYTDDNYGPKGNRHAHMDYEQLKEVSDSGLVEIQNHTYNMHGKNMGRFSVGKLNRESFEDYKNALSEDLLLLQNKIKEKIGFECTTVTYPFGKYAQETEQALKELGFKASLTCTAGINKIAKNSALFNLKRFNRPGELSSKEFFERMGIIPISN